MYICIINIHTNVHTHHTCIRAHIYTDTHTLTQHTHVTLTDSQTHRYTSRTHTHTHKRMHARMHARTHARMHAHTHAHIHTYTHTHMDTCIHACMHVQTHTIHTSMHQTLTRMPHIQTPLFSHILQNLRSSPQNSLKNLISSHTFLPTKYMVGDKWVGWTFNNCRWVGGKWGGREACFQ